MTNREERQASIASHAVDSLGLIETGLETQNSAATHATNTSTSKPGRCIIRKYNAIDRRNRKETIILHPMKCTIPSGGLTAIIGPSGSGKSALLDFLAECALGSTIAEGEVNLSTTKSYVHDEADLLGFYTPRSYLNHYDKLTTGLRNGCKSQDEIENILKSLGILEQRRNIIVGDTFRRGLNKGEIRRLNLGLMMLGAPDTIFIEEPLQGLDSETALEVMDFLKGYCFRPGRRAIVTLSKPSSVVWNLIDTVILISQGRLIYEGPRFDMESFFASNKCPTPKRICPVEHYLSVVSSVRVAKTMDRWVASFDSWQSEVELNTGDMLADDVEVGFPPAQTAAFIINPATEYKRNCYYHVWVFLELTKRYFLNLIFNVGFLWLRLFMYFIFSMFICILFQDIGSKTTTSSIWARSSLIFFVLSFFTLMTVAVIPARCCDKKIVLKEEFNGYYHPVTHHFANTIASVFAVTILTLVMTIIFVPMEAIEHPLEFATVMFLSLNCAEGLSQLATLIAPNYIYGMAFYVGLLGFYIPLMGFMIIPSEFPSWLKWAYYVPFHTYAWRSLMVRQFKDSDIIFDSLEYPTGLDVLKAYEIDNVNYYADLSTLILYGIVVHFICVVILCVRDKYFVRKLNKVNLISNCKNEVQSQQKK